MTEKRDKNIVVLGGGISGISALYHLQIQNVSATGYEAQSNAGGLVSNFTIDGFRFDNAIHLSFTTNEYVRSIFDKTSYITHSPTAFSYEKGCWLRHPVQNNLYPLRVAEKVELIKSFIDRPSEEPTNYLDWLYFQYGEAISKRFPIPYTYKYWGLPPENLSLSWIGNRVRRGDISEILKGALEQRAENHYYAKEMRYPKEGGYWEFLRPLTKHIDLRCSHRAIELNTKKKIVVFDNGCEVPYSILISSLPLPEIISLIKDAPEAVKKSVAELKCTAVDLISVGCSQPEISPYLWFYIYDQDIYPARGYSPSMKSSANAPPGCSSLQFEIYSLNTDKPKDPGKLQKNVIESIIKMGVCGADDILFAHHKRLKYGNVVFDLGMEQHRAVVLEYLKQQGIISCGRFGEWEYFWSDQSFQSGQKAAEEVVRRVNV